MLSAFWKSEYLSMLTDWLVSNFEVDKKEANKMLEYCRFDDLVDKHLDYICHYNISYWGKIIYENYKDMREQRENRGEMK